MLRCARTLRQRARVWHLAPLLSVLVWLGGSPAVAADSLLVVRIEEDWELVVRTPDAESVAPQVTCTFSPVADLKSLHATFELNHQSLPSFVAGGLQLQLWNHASPVSSRKFPNAAVMSQANETVRWTQGMELSDGQLTFEIINGNSTTWGNFGGQGFLRGAVPTQLGSLIGYDPAVSVQHSGVGFAANRVHSLVLKKVRVFTSTGQILEDDTVRVVYQHQ